MTKEEYASIKLWIVGAYNNHDISDIVWYEMLKDFDYSMCLEAVKNVIKVAKYTMTIAAITEEYNKLLRVRSISEIVYLHGVAGEMLEKRIISDEKYNEIEYQISYDELTRENKNKLYTFKKDKQVLDILKRRYPDEVKQLN